MIYHTYMLYYIPGLEIHLGTQMPLDHCRKFLPNPEFNMWFYQRALLKQNYFPNQAGY